MILTKRCRHGNACIAWWLPTKERKTHLITLLTSNFSQSEKAVKHEPLNACCHLPPPPRPPPLPPMLLPAMQYDPLQECCRLVPLLSPTCTHCSVSLCRACCRRLPPSHTKDGRHGLFGTLQGSETGPPSVDCWMGHPLVNPTKGKLGIAAPTDLKGEACFHCMLAAPPQAANKFAFREASCPCMQHALSWCIKKHMHTYMQAHLDLMRHIKLPVH